MACLRMATVLNSELLQAVEGSERKGMGRYVKKKKLDPLDTYVPAVIAAKNQLQRAGGIMSKSSPVLQNNGHFHMPYGAS